MAAARRLETNAAGAHCNRSGASAEVEPLRRIRSSGKTTGPQPGGVCERCRGGVHNNKRHSISRHSISRRAILRHSILRRSILHTVKRFGCDATAKAVSDLLFGFGYAVASAVFGPPRPADVARFSDSVSNFQESA
jgi:hypothetical protein